MAGLHFGNPAIYYNLGLDLKPPGGVAPQPPITILELSGSLSLYSGFGSATIEDL